MQPKRILIAGANSAIAREMARLYAQRGARLFLLARDSSRLGDLRAELGDAVLGSLVVDLADVARVEAAVTEAWSALGGVDVAHIAHGYLGDQLASERDLSEAELIIRTNFLSAVALLIPLANRMEAAGRGTISVITSVAGDRGRPRNYTYGASKGALGAYLQGMRSRLYPKGVRVQTIKLGPVDTPMTATHRKHVLFASAASVAATIVRFADGGGAGVAYVPGFWRPVMAVVRALPEFVFQRFSFLAGR